jgi:hypothetical protein
MRTDLIIEQARFIRENTHEVEVSIVFGGAMAILVILVFMLDLRSMLISSVALPTSVVSTFFVMYLLKFSLNMMTLLALSLAIGLLIDDAVVVRENIQKHLERGEGPRTASLNGTREICCFYMIDHVGERFEGTVSAFVGTGAFVTLVEPFVDVLVRLEDLGAEYQIEDDGLMATSSRSGDAIRLGDRMFIEVSECAILRRTVYAKRVRSADEAAAARAAAAAARRARRAAADARSARRTSGADRGPL